MSKVNKLNNKDKLQFLSLEDRQFWNENFNDNYKFSDFMSYIDTIMLFFLINIILILSYGSAFLLENSFDIYILGHTTINILKVIWILIISFLIMDIISLCYLKYIEYKWWKEIEIKYKKDINIYGDKN